METRWRMESRTSVTGAQWGVPPDALSVAASKARQVEDLQARSWSCSRSLAYCPGAASRTTFAASDRRRRARSHLAVARPCRTLGAFPGRGDSGREPADGYERRRIAHRDAADSRLILPLFGAFPRGRHAREPDARMPPRSRKERRPAIVKEIDEVPPVNHSP